MSHSRWDFPTYGDVIIAGWHDDVAVVMKWLKKKCDHCKEKIKYNQDDFQ